MPANKMTTDLETDVAVIGAGSTGSAVAWRLGAAGFRVVCVERGDWFDYAKVPADEAGRQQLQSGPLNANPNVRKAPADYPIEDDESPIKPLLGNGVGGSSIYWAGHAPRFRSDDFSVHSTDGVGADWPLAYAELEPYYALNEQRIGLAWRPGDPLGPKRSATPQPLPPIGDAAERIAQAFEAMGWHWWPVDLVMGSESPQAPCTHLGPCHIGCPARVRAGADKAYMHDAVGVGVRLLTNTRVLRLEHDVHDRVTAGVCASDGGQFRVRADRFVIAANGLGTPRLLLLSASSSFPDGLANRSGLVGRGLMLHPYAWVDGLFPHPMKRDAGQRAGIVSLEFGRTGSGNGFVRGFKLQLSVGAPAEGSGVDTDRRGHVASLSVSAEDLPEDTNRVVLSSDRVDHDGLPLARMIYRVSANSRAMLDFGVARASEVLKKAGAEEVVATPLKTAAGFHLMGTTRMGNDPMGSVVDRFGRCHDIPNLYIADASMFVTSSAMNPTATAQALALRLADHLIATRRD